MQHIVFCLSDLAARVAAKFVGDPSCQVTGINTLEDASSTDVSFLANAKYLTAFKQSKAGAICVRFDTPLDPAKNYLLSENPSQTFQKIAELFFHPSTSGFQGIHPTAVIHPSSQIHPSAHIGPYVVIDQNCTIGPDTVIHSHTSISADVTIGSSCTIHSNCVIREQSILGDRIILQPGVIIGACGFGYTPDERGCYQKLEQLGNVVLENDVEIGAHTVVDRSRFKTTRICKGSKIDNLCQIAHNVQVGEHNIIAAQTGIAGSVTTGKHVMLGGQVGIVGHVKLDDQVMVATRGGVSKSLKKGQYRGSPAIAIQDFNRQEVFIRKLESYTKKVKELEERLNAISSSSHL